MGNSVSIPSSESNNLLSTMSPLIISFLLLVVVNTQASALKAACANKSEERRMCEEDNEDFDSEGCLPGYKPTECNYDTCTSEYEYGSCTHRVCNGLKSCDYNK